MQHLKILTSTYLFFLSGYLSDQQLPVCVVGAGPSGITMARKLKANNIPYRIFEAESQVGGKAYTWRDNDNNAVEMGAIYFVKQDYSINKAVQDAGLSLSWFNGSSIHVYSQTGGGNPLPVDSDNDRAAFVDAVNRYSNLRDSYNLTVGYVNAPAEAQVSLSQWLNNKNLNALRTFFIANIVVQGYGALNDIPALYAIKTFNLRGLSSLQQFGYAFWSITDGSTKLWQKLSENLNVELYRKVSRIVRSANATGFQSSQLIFENQGLLPVTCSHVVVAFPPYLSKLQAMMPDLDSREQMLISQIKNNYYSTSVVENTGKNWDSGVFLNLESDEEKYPYEPVGNGETVGFLKQGKYYSAYSWIRGDYRGPTPALTLNNFQTERSKLLTLMDISRASSSQVIFEKSFTYFPHVNSNDIKLGFFKDFDALQGYKNTFYLTSALSFETMNQCIEMSESVFLNKVLPKVKG